MKTPVIAFIGAGNMAQCLIKGLIAHQFPARNIWASNPGLFKLEVLHSEFGINIADSNKTAAEKADIIVLAVKPVMMKAVIKDLKDVIKFKFSSSSGSSFTQSNSGQNSPFVISVAAGVTSTAISDWLGFNAAVIRCMPNVCALSGESATGMYANPYADNLQKDLAENILKSVGLTLWVEQEKLIDAIGALSGSGPAYFFWIMEALEKAGEELGLSPETAHLLTLQTALGAARLALSGNQPLRELRARVTSKGGMTEQAVAVLESHQTKEAFIAAVKAAYEKSCEHSTWT